ncbi:hypothetical protein [Parasporobacterium paucivorans]|uniref:Uncharacterized protein n=1 Tax=Parasporobacterium paucivorans DSM 15970 TaxID=1122934 RepID=A0A1M6IJZ1_9FIRM|nr:hypothetical protein [Parasporobacterium paucivorans]SHJ34704.1 hypothetical protein SAMN02745691_01800 [Parasporobacterium paucivorans DSM 15970]
MSEFKSKYGVIKGITRASYYPDGQLRECRLVEENRISTEAGILIPKYDFYETRTKSRNAMEFYASGELKSAYLEKRQQIETPFGKIMAEMVTFYEGGSIRRVFPTYGQISGYWSEKEEGDLLEGIGIQTDRLQINAKLSCISQYPSGKLKSLTLWPGETVTVDTSYGPVTARIGISLYENGVIKSLEPSRGTPISTLAGEFITFDLNAMGIHGDRNSLCFYENAAIKSLTTMHSGIRIAGDGKMETITPVLVPSMADIEIMVISPIKINFGEKGLAVTDSLGGKHLFSEKEYEFTSFPVSFGQSSPPVFAD